MKIFTVLIFCFALVGCATQARTPPPWLASTMELSAAGRCSDAHEMLDRKGPPGEQSALWNMAVYYDCDKDMKKFIDYATLCARYGNDICRDELAKKGEPVPVADLKSPDRSQSSDLSGLNIIAAGINKGLQPKKRLTCTHTGIFTDCEED